MAKLENIMKGIVTRTTVAGTPVAGATQTESSGDWGYDDPIIIENQNGNGTELTINSVTGGTDGALVEGTDYFVGTDSLGQTVVTIIDSATVTTEAQDMVIDYDYTPNASQTVSGGTSKVATERYVKIVGPSADDPLLERTVILEEAVIDGDVEFPFLDTEEANDVGVMPVTFINDKNATWSITDEINPN